MADITMLSAIEGLGLSHLYPAKEVSGTYVCPICGSDGKKKLNINFRKNVFNCPRCGFGGTPLDFWAYYRNISGTKQEIYRKAGIDYNKALGEGRAEVKVPRKAPQKGPHQCDILPAEKRNDVYSRFLSELGLIEKHRENLIKRGLSIETIESAGYRSAPMISTEPLCHRMLSEGYSLEGVPGFFRSGSGWHFVKYGSGFLIPTRDVSGNIQGLQLRRDDAEGARYLTISSSERELGTKGTTEPHINPGNGDFSRVILTEGPLKADIISQFTGFPCIAVLGVLSLGHLSDVLKEMKTKGTGCIYIAYDMDMYENENVRRAYGKLKGLIASAGFRHATLEWDTEYKGLDDYLLARKGQQK